MEEKRVTLNRAAGLSYYSAFIAIWFVIERFGEINLFLCTIFACGSGYETTGKAWHEA